MATKPILSPNEFLTQVKIPPFSHFLIEPIFADAKLIGTNQKTAPIIKKKIALNPDVANDEKRSIVKMIEAENEKKEKKDSLVFFENLLFLFIKDT